MHGGVTVEVLGQDIGVCGGGGQECQEEAFSAFPTKALVGNAWVRAHPSPGLNARAR